MNDVPNTPARRRSSVLAISIPSFFAMRSNSFHDISHSLSFRAIARPARGHGPRQVFLHDLIALPERHSLNATRNASRSDAGQVTRAHARKSASSGTNTASLGCGAPCGKYGADVPDDRSGFR